VPGNPVIPAATHSAGTHISTPYTVLI
jgi:hypothetical protein